MATDEAINKLKEAEEVYLSIDREKLLRTNLGEESLAVQLEPVFEELDSKYSFAYKYAKHVHDNPLNEIIRTFTDINNQFTQQAERNSQEYIAQKGGFLSSCNTYLQNLKLHWPAFVAAAVEDRGLLQDEGILKQYEQTVASLHKESEETIEKIRTEAEATIENAKKLAEDIENKARKTAAKISVQAAQDQFSEASNPLGWMVIFWGVASVVSLILFFWLISQYIALEVPEEWTWQVIYFAAIRLTALGAIGTIAAFTMKGFKSALHMYLHNKHRLRLTNCIEAFVESAVTPEQRDLILAQLVEAVASFGNSGFLDKEGNLDQGPRMTIDNITRTFTDTSK